jgi:hypothetical protein
MKNSKILVVLICLMQVSSLFAITPDELMHLDVNKDYSDRTVSELRLMRSMMFARHGYLFKKSELRDYFMDNYKWYSEMVYKNAELQQQGQPEVKAVLTVDEKKFVDKIDVLIKEKCRQNYFTVDSCKVPNTDNLANYFEKKPFRSDRKKVLEKYGFAIEQDSIEQLFHLYDENQYSHTPGFYTTDLYLQLLHIYFSYTLKVIEKEKLVGIITALSDNLYKESLKYYTSATDEKIRQMSGFNLCFYAVAYTLITNKMLDIPAEWSSLYKEELQKIKTTEDAISPLFRSFMPYSLFIPRGYYSRTDEQKRYFKAMMWLQVAPYCLSDNDLLSYACFNAFMLNNGKDNKQTPFLQLYNSVYEPIAFLIGDADNLSVRDICAIFNENGIKEISQLTEKKTLALVEHKLSEKVEKQDKIQPKIKLACEPKINFMPQRYLVDNDILQQFSDTTVGAAKAFPKGLEFFSVMGVNIARDLLYNHYKENLKWNVYDSVMQQQTAKFKSFDSWNATVYNKWLDCLIKLNKVNKDYPYFMQNRGWQLKNINTSLASWTELKHDAILYGEQPMTAEMGDGGDELPPPVTLEYVEPNLDFWNACKEMLAKNDLFLTKYRLKTEELTNKTKEIKEILNLFITASKKELEGKSLTDEEYSKLEYISGSFDYLSLNMLNPYVQYSSWYDVTGPDKTIALVVDVYTRNVPRCPNNGILHEATGLGNVIYVVVEFEGRLYLTRGATFSYYEFPYEKRLTDEEWLGKVKQNEITSVDWMKEVMINY